MNDLRSPSEDRPYNLSARPQAQAPSPRLAQDDVDPEYGMSFFDRIRYSRWFPLASVFAAVLIFSSIISYAYKQGSQSGADAATPVVMADSKDYKEKPANPGGMDVPFQDAVVFDQLQNKDQNATNDGKTESLLPPPEQPAANNNTVAPAVAPEAKAPAAQPAATSETGAAPVVNQTIPENAVTAAASQANETQPVAAATTVTAATVASTLATAPDEDAAAIPAASVPEKTVTAPVKKAAPKKTVATASAPKARAAATAKVAAGTYRIQLGAFRDEAAARAAWSKTAKQFGQLAGVSSAFPKADLGAKGTFYRAQGVNLSKDSADNLCHTINAGKAGSCIVTH